MKTENIKDLEQFPEYKKIQELKKEIEVLGTELKNKMVFGEGDVVEIIYKGGVYEGCSDFACVRSIEFYSDIPYYNFRQVKKDHTMSINKYYPKGSNYDMTLIGKMNFNNLYESFTKL